MPMTDLPREAKACSNAQLTSVLPTPVSVPVTKKPWPTSPNLGVRFDTAPADLAQRGRQVRNVLRAVSGRERDSQPRGAFGHRGRADRGHQNPALAQCSAGAQRPLVRAQNEGLDRGIGWRELGPGPSQRLLEGGDEVPQAVAPPLLLPDQL